MPNKYIGISYLPIFDNRLSQRFFKKFMCKHHYHLFDEVYSCLDEHYLHCDACGFVVHIKEE